MAVKEVYKIPITEIENTKGVKKKQASGKIGNENLINP